MKLKVKMFVFLKTFDMLEELFLNHILFIFILSLSHVTYKSQDVKHVLKSVQGKVKRFMESWNIAFRYCWFILRIHLCQPDES